MALPDAATCDYDGSACTAKDHCKAGECKGVAELTCECVGDTDCAKFEDGNLCNGTLFCHIAAKRSRLNPATVVRCATGLDTDCELNRCTEKTGKCAVLAVTDKSSCDADDSACTVYDTCSKGQCVAGSNICECQLDSWCDSYQDNNACTAALYCSKPGKPPWFCEPNPAKVVKCPPGLGCMTQKCDPATGACQKTPVVGSKPCDDGSVCTSDDGCFAGKCTGTAKVCVKANACVDPKCDPSTGICVQNKTLCDDGNLCTDDACDIKKGGCAHLPTNDSCDDGDACTLSDACTKTATGAACVGKAKPCSSNNPCATDACRQKTGKCQHVHNTGACEDDQGCTVKDICKSGKCVGQPRNCEDGNSCPWTAAAFKATCASTTTSRL